MERPDTAHPEYATVDIAVIEAPTRRLEGGVGYSTDVKFRANANYRDVNFDGSGLQLLAEGRLETKIQSGSLRFARPPNESGWIATFGGGRPTLMSACVRSSGETCTTFSGLPVSSVAMAAK